MNEELDYMSDEFLAKCLDSSSDVRPGLLKTRNEQRQHNLLKKKTDSLQPKKQPPEVLQAEVLEEGLKQPINSSNKGFSMLAKMGFKSGMGLGKDSKGIVEPIGINIKNDRKGLGHKKPPKPIKISKEKKDELNKINENEYRKFLSQKNKEGEVISDLKKSQRICRELDDKSSKEPEESWFWPDDCSGDEKEEDSDSEKEEVDLSNSEKLEMLTRYLRENYFYCIWCKVQYNDAKDMEDCPGVTRDDH